MKKLVTVMAVLLFVVGCDNSKPDIVGQSVLKHVNGTEYSIDLSCVVTKGNHSFVPLNTYFPYDDDCYPKTILDVEDEFEKRHPELRVAWRIEKVRGGRFGNVNVIGLWADHQPK